MKIMKKLIVEAENRLNIYKTGCISEIEKNWDVDDYYRKLDIIALTKSKFFKKYKFKDFYVFFDARELSSYSDCTDGYALILMMKDNVLYKNHGFSRTNHVAFQEKNIVKVSKISEIIPDIITHRIIKDYQLLSLIAVKLWTL